MNPNLPSLGGHANAKKYWDAYMANPNKCKTCEKPILSVPSGLLWQLRERKFCDKSCAAVFNNRAKPKRQRIVPDRKCAICKTPFEREEGPSFYTRTFCKSCGASRETLEGMRPVASFRHDTIRYKARRVLERAGVPKACARCGFDFSVECSHKRAVKTFPPETPLSEVNALSNLEWLCPNCHAMHESAAA